jgi:hypothetical protein
MGLTTLEERRHQTDMVQVFKIVTGNDMVKSDSWFKLADCSERLTRSTADPLNLRPQAARLEVRKNFFSHRVIEDWNRVPPELKRARTVKSFKTGYAEHRAKFVGST